METVALPRIDDLLDKLRTAKCMTHLDLRSTYNQVRMSYDGPHDDSIAATTFHGIKPNKASCLLERLVMGFGLCNAPAIFSRLTNHVLEPCHPIGRVVGRMPKYLHSGDTCSKPPGVPCGVAQFFLRCLRHLRVRRVQAKLE